MSRAGRCAAWAAALALLAGAPAAAQPWARLAVPDPELVPALRAAAPAYETQWNALLVSELRATLAAADSAAALRDLARRIARAEPEALGSRIGLDALRLRERWTRRERGERVAAAVAESLGNAAETARQAARADSLYRAALGRYVALGEARRRAWVLGSMGRNAFGHGELAAAESLYTLALAARRAIGDERMIGASLNALGSTAWQRGRYAAARDFYREARAVRLRTGERAALSQTASFLGLAWRALGEPDSAQAAFGEALAIAVSLGDSARVLDALVNRLDLLGRHGDLAATEAAERRGLAIARERGAADREVAILLNAALAHERFGRFTDARLRVERALALAPGPAQRLDALNELGRLRLRVGDGRGAREPLERALALADSLNAAARRALALNNLAIAARLEGDAPGGERLAGEALAAGAAAGDSTAIHAALVTLGDAARARGDLAAARRAFARAAGLSGALGAELHAADLNNWAAVSLDSLDAAERRFGAARRLAAESGATVAHAFALYGLGDVAERRGDVAAALRHARAAATVMDTTRSRQDEAAAITLASQWRYTFDALIHLLVRLDAAHPDSGFAAEAFHWTERARARALLDLMAGRSGGARPLTLAAARALVTEPRAALIEYAFGDSSTTAWVVTARGARHVSLPARRALQPRIETLRRGLADPARALEIRTLAAARALHEALVEPLLPLLDGVERVTISPDGALALIPFEALLAALPRAGGAPRDRDWLGSRWAISYAFSAATLAAPSRREPAGEVLAIAAPDYRGALPPLPGAAAESAALGRVAAGRGLQFAALSGGDATRERLLAHPALGRAGLIHVATHGVADEGEPLRSGLWLAADSTGRPGFLPVADVAGLDLDAALVTLSACETGLGRLERGEGVVGLTRAFLAAGARSVVVSLWKVDDGSASRLMDGFYRELLGRGRARDAALAGARRALMKSAATRSPFHWAAFVLVGEPGPLGLVLEHAAD